MVTMGYIGALTAIASAIISFIAFRPTQQDRKRITSSIVAFALIGLIVLRFVRIEHLQPNTEVSISKMAEHSANLSAEQQLIQSNVAKANEAQITAYRDLPQVSLNGLRKFYGENSPAYQEIARLILRSKEKGVIINNPGNPSEFQIISISEPLIQGDIAYVQTTERWVLSWYSLSAKKYTKKYISDVSNRHDYTLRRLNSAWKIEEDSYRP